MLRLLTAGESHGPQITAILDGMPAGVRVDAEAVARGMARRQVGFGRGNRMKIEKDAVQFLSGLRFGESLGSPITLVVENRDFENWSDALAAFGASPGEGARRITRPRPGHADLVGMLKYEREDARDILERASARETVARVAVGELLRGMLAALDIKVFSHVRSIGDAEAQLGGLSLDETRQRAEDNDLRCAEGYERLRSAVEVAGEEGDTLGGVFEVVVEGLPPGLGSSMSPDRKLDARLAAALVSIPAVKGCELGPAFDNARLRGSQVHDEIFPDPQGLPRRGSNRAGGLEGGMSTGEALICRGAMKPISTLKKPLASVDMSTGQPSKAAFERSDVCAVPAAGVIAEAVVMFVIADALLEMFASDTFTRLDESLRSYRRGLIHRMQSLPKDKAD